MIGILHWTQHTIYVQRNLYFLWFCYSRTTVNRASQMFVNGKITISNITFCHFNIKFELNLHSLSQSGAHNSALRQANIVTEKLDRVYLLAT